MEMHKITSRTEAVRLIENGRLDINRRLHGKDYGALRITWVDKHPAGNDIAICADSWDIDEKGFPYVVDEYQLTLSDLVGMYV